MRIRSSLLAPMVVVLFLATIWIGKLWELPSMERTFAAAPGEVHSADFVVEGLRCRGTSNFFMSMTEGVPGIVSVTTFVQEHRATIKFDPSQIDIQGISRAIEQPVRLRDGRVVSPFRVLEIRE
jgi:copper chaperone CopZ